MAKQVDAQDLNLFLNVTRSGGSSPPGGAKS